VTVGALKVTPAESGQGVHVISGMGFRFAFAYYAYHSGGPAIARFSASYHITGAEAWTTALFLMAAGQVIARVGLRQVRRVNAISHAAATGPVPEHDHQGRASRSPQIPDTSQPMG
jgi:hypothetical protein